MTTPTKDEIAKRAAGVRKAPATELTDIRVQEIALVPRGANARFFVMRKSDAMKIKMHPTAKASAQTALADLHDKVASALAIVSAAEEDETATDGSPEVGELMKACADTAGGIGEQYGKKKTAEKTADETEKAGDKKPFPGAAPPFGADGKPVKEEGAADDKGDEKKNVKKDAAEVTKAELDNFTAATVTIGAARDQIWSVCDMMGKDPAGAAEKLKQIVGMLETAAGFLGASSAGAMAKAAVAKSAEAVEKAGRVLSKKNAGALQAACDAMRSAVDTITTLLTEAGGTSDVEMTAKGTSTVTKSDDAAEKALADAQEIKKSADAQLSEASAKLAAADAKLVEVQKAQAALADAERVMKAASASRASGAADVQTSNAGAKTEPVRARPELPDDLTDLLKAKK